MIEKIRYIIFDKFNILLKVNEHIRSVLLFILFTLFSLSASFGSVSALLIAFSLNSRFLSLIVIFLNLLNEYVRNDIYKHTFYYNFYNRK